MELRIFGSHTEKCVQIRLIDLFLVLFGEFSCRFDLVKGIYKNLRGKIIYPNVGHTS